MAEKEEGHGAWSRVPTWDGSPQTWRSFRREMAWWTSALDLESTKKYNLAARWLLRQSGMVRARGEEFTPYELEHQPEVVGKDPATGEDVVITPADPLRGIKILMKALEEMNGKTTLDKLGELRSQFYLELKRRPGERISEFCTRFRTMVADLRQEGVTLPSGELGWFLRSKLGLDQLRLQLLDTALGGKEDYDDIEREVLRLFKELHSQDPLVRRQQTDSRPPLFSQPAIGSQQAFLLYFILIQELCGPGFCRVQADMIIYTYPCRHLCTHLQLHMHYIYITFMYYISNI